MSKVYKVRWVGKKSGQEMGLLGRGSQFRVQCSLEQGQEDPRFMALFSVPPGMSQPEAGTGTVALGSFQRATTFLCEESHYNHLVGLMLPPAWRMTRIIPGKQPSARKSLMTFEG